MNITPASPAQSGAPVERKDSPVGQLGQQDFLRLLVAQMENQDPTKPMDNFQFLSQIAQFGMVDGIQNLESSFGSVADSFRQTQLLQASSLLGQEVLAESNLATLSPANGLRGVVDVPDGASQVSVEIRDEAGILVDTLNLGASSGGEMTFEWDGIGSDGQALPWGQYFIHAQGTTGGETTGLRVNTFNRVDSITMDDQAVVSVTLASGETVDLASVREIR